MYIKNNNYSMFRYLITLIILLILSIGFISCQEDQARPKSDVQIGTAISKDKVRIKYVSKGSGNLAVVFVHGWSCDKSYWNAQMDYFASKYQVVAIDLAGHGESGINRKNYKMKSYGHDVAAVVKKLKLKKVVLVGHSMGGSVILEAAILLKNKVLGLVGVDNFQDVSRKYPKEEVRILKNMRKNFKKFADKFVRSMFPKNADPKLINKIAKDMSSAPPKVAISSMKNFFSYKFLKSLKKLRKLRIPLKCINADKWPTNVKGNKKYIPSYSVKIMKGKGHFVQNEDPKQFNRLLSEVIIELK